MIGTEGEIQASAIAGDNLSRPPVAQTAAARNKDDGMSDMLKLATGRAIAAIDPQCEFRRCIFILAHMRCGSTALSNILCSRRDVSGYGEAHIRYESRSALGRLVFNQARRGAWSPLATHLFDKILHSHHDQVAPPEFFEARAIFIARQPGAAIRSIKNLYTKLERPSLATDVTAASYYLERMKALFGLWERFPVERRVGVTHAELMADPDLGLARISEHLKLRPSLENRYESRAISSRPGVGDPLRSGSLNRIERWPDASDDRLDQLDIDPATGVAVAEAYERFRELVMRDRLVLGTLHFNAPT